MRFDCTAAQRRLALALTLLALIGTACVHQSPTTTPVVAVSPQPATPDPVLSLLEYASKLARTTPGQREQAVEAARDAVADAAGAMTYARLALAYGAPAQRRYTPDEVPRYARLALQAKDAHWSKAGRQYLQDYARLYSQFGRQQQTVDQSPPPSKRPSTPSNANDDQRIAELESQLASARRKLRELANIENTLGKDAP